MAMDIIACAAAINADYQLALQMEGGDPTFLGKMAAHIDAEFQKGELSETNVDITTAAGTLDFSDAANTGFAIPITAYWASTTGTGGIPVNICLGAPSAIVGVTNTASTLTAPITIAIDALSGLTELPPGEPFEAFVSAIITDVLTLAWTVNEAGTGPGGEPCVNVYNVTII